METEARFHVVMTQQTNDFAVVDIPFLNPVPSQIGSNIFLTAAHCLINDSDEDHHDDSDENHHDR